MDQNWVKNETSQNWIFPSSIDAPSLGKIFQVTFSPISLRGDLRMSSPSFRQWLLELLLLPTYWMTEKEEEAQGLVLSRKSNLESGPTRDNIPEESIY